MRTNRAVAQAENTPTRNNNVHAGGGRGAGFEAKNIIALVLHGERKARRSTAMSLTPPRDSMARGVKMMTMAWQAAPWEFSPRQPRGRCTFFCSTPNG